VANVSKDIRLILALLNIHKVKVKNEFMVKFIQVKKINYFSANLRRKTPTNLGYHDFKTTFMKRKLRLLSVGCMVSITSIFAQQDPALTHGMYTKMNFNPAATGSGDGICGTLVYRNMWDKVNGAPNTIFFNAEANLDRFVKGLGVGIGAIHDAIGFNRQNTANLNLSYKLRFKNKSFIAIGVGAGILNMGLSPTWITPQPNTVDLILPIGFSATNMDFNAGLFFKSRTSYVGVSSTHLSETILSSGASPLMTYNPKRHYYFMAGWRDGIDPSGDFDVDLNALMRTDLNKFSVDLSARVFLKKKFYGGVGYRTSDAVLVLLGMEVIPNLTVGYAYDITTNRFANISWGTHEIMLRYCRPIPIPPPTIHRNPRYL
jgi:type IX secretion system PorP/SprF family membrane protein